LNPATQRVRFKGPAGSIEAALDEPVAPEGLAVIAHPHPLFGGSLDNKVVQTIARAFLAQNMVCLRPNFRGVGQTEGSHDQGEGEVDDLFASWDWLISQFPAVQGRRWMGGFSFGAVMTTHVADQWPRHARTATEPELSRVVLVGLGLSADRRQPAALTEAARLIHGELDDVISLTTVLDWIRPQRVPITVLPGAGHFFHGQLTELKTCVNRALAS